MTGRRIDEGLSSDAHGRDSFITTCDRSDEGRRFRILPNIDLVY